ncbi:imidazolonepropionase [Neogemmobacter tilapiae]|uniref:Imidazolonepropionase n=1 Tax=Neogemmobacter tilapiae TaxID=875041 RepID=A0A918TP82_9RHOB|nr:imidazolonepropionase [Gemmobacter tilapiae]GHC50678.1 imidazolonepropionase [Gemmobacter tilapiae]
MRAPVILENCQTAIPDAAIVMDERLLWLGPRADLPGDYAGLVRHDLGGRLVTPALIDCHTHIVHGGNRAGEFAQRLEGVSYEEIARAGGGILSTVRATRAATQAELVAKALPFVDALLAEGVGTIEIKSGYGLEAEAELRMLRAAREIAGLRDVTVKTTYLAAHAVPPEYKGRADAYLDEVCIPTLRVAHAEGLVDAVDAFCEGIAFSSDQVDRLFRAAKALNLPVKLHAEQLSNLHGAALAAGHGALSADHLEWLDEDGVKAMAAAVTVAVLLPGAFYALRETRLPPIDLLRRHGVAMAVATDMNPGTSPLSSLLLAMNMACTLFRLTPAEALDGVTRQAARALGLSDRGELVVGQRADLAVWNCESVAELSYRIGFNPLHQRIIGGVL